MKILQYILFRYTNILPYDKNRVKLQEQIDGSDYINASWISKDSDLGYGGSPSEVSFITSQGPTDKTSSQHLQMITENKVDITVMLTKCTEQSATGT